MCWPSNAESRKISNLCDKKEGPWEGLHFQRMSSRRQSSTTSGRAEHPHERMTWPLWLGSRLGLRWRPTRRQARRYGNINVVPRGLWPTEPFFSRLRNCAGRVALRRSRSLRRQLFECLHFASTRYWFEVFFGFCRRVYCRSSCNYCIEAFGSIPWNVPPANPSYRACGKTFGTVSLQTKTRRPVLSVVLYFLRRTATSSSATSGARISSELDVRASVMPPLRHSCYQNWAQMTTDTIAEVIVC